MAQREIYKVFIPNTRSFNLPSLLINVEELLQKYKGIKYDLYVTSSQLKDIVSIVITLGHNVVYTIQLAKSTCQSLFKYVHDSPIGCLSNWGGDINLLNVVFDDIDRKAIWNLRHVE